MEILNVARIIKNLKYKNLIATYTKVGKQGIIL